MYTPTLYHLEKRLKNRNEIDNKLSWKCLFMLLPIAWPGRTALGLFVMMEVGQYLVQVTKFQTGKPWTHWFHVIYLNEGRILSMNCMVLIRSSCGYLLPQFYIKLVFKAPLSITLRIKICVVAYFEPQKNSKTLFIKELLWNGLEFLGASSSMLISLSNEESLKTWSPSYTYISS